LTIATVKAITVAMRVEHRFSNSMIARDYRCNFHRLSIIGSGRGMTRVIFDAFMPIPATLADRPQF
jgi:hypothetical protein